VRRGFQNKWRRIFRHEEHEGNTKITKNIFVLFVVKIPMNEKNKMKVTMLGLGIMGGGAAMNLVKKGFATTVWNRTRDKAQAVLDAGATWAATPAKAVAEADVVISFVADDDASKAVWLGEAGALKAMKPGAIAIECGTMSVEWIRELAAHAQVHSVKFMDAPVTGSKMAAANGQLTLLVGADDDVLATARPALEAISATLFHFGPVSSGAIFKLINNMIAAAQLVSLAEGLALARKTGLNMDVVAQAAPAGAIGSGIVKMKLPNALSHNHGDVHFALKWMLKDVNYALQLAQQAGVNMPAISHTQAQFAKAAEMGLAEMDTSAVMDAIE
jgi:3-hydroxyisobutyrate dehydrogenase